MNSATRPPEPPALNSDSDSMILAGYSYRVRLLLGAALGAVAALAFYTPRILGISPTTAMGSGFEGVITFLGLLLMVILLAAVPVGLFLLFKRLYREDASVMILAGVVSLAIAFPLELFHEQLFKSAMRDFEIRMKPLIAAIASFEAEHREPPRTLDDLVPSHLARIPESDLGFAPRLQYSVADRRHLMHRRVWYQMGSATDTGWASPRLEFDLNEWNEIVDAQVSGVDVKAPRSAIDSSRWSRRGSQRSAMAFDAFRRFRNGTPFDSALAVLGPPDGEWEARFPKWWLVAQGHPELIYTPTKTAPDGLNGYLDRSFGDWFEFSRGSGD